MVESIDRMRIADVIKTELALSGQNKAVEDALWRVASNIMARCLVRGMAGTDFLNACGFQTFSESYGKAGAQ